MTTTKTTTNAITSDMYLANKKKDEKQTGNSSLGKDAFLQILITQMQNQDPTNPMNDTEFIAQMAQFSSLEQMTNMATAFEGLAQAQMQTQMIQYNSFVGKEVKWHEVSGELDENKKPIIVEGTGTIVSLKYVDGSVEFTLADGKKITPGNISEVLSGDSSSSNSLVEASMMIGKNITYIPTATEPEAGSETKPEEQPEKTASIESVSRKDGVIVFNLSDGTSIKADQITSVR